MTDDARSGGRLQQAPRPPTWPELYREARERGLGRISSLIVSAIGRIITASLWVGRERQLRRKQQIQQEERWRQEVRDGE